MTQFQYDKLMNTLAKALQTQRRFIKLVAYYSMADGAMAYTVNLRGYFYRVILRGYNIVQVAREIKAV